MFKTVTHLKTLNLVATNSPSSHSKSLSKCRVRTKTACQPKAPIKADQTESKSPAPRTSRLFNQILKTINKISLRARKARPPRRKAKSRWVMRSSSFDKSWSEWPRPCSSTNPLTKPCRLSARSSSRRSHSSSRWLCSRALQG